jgi:hypothetical protein
MIGDRFTIDDRRLPDCRFRVDPGALIFRLGRVVYPRGFASKVIFMPALLVVFGIIATEPAEVNHPSQPESLVTPT